MFVEVEVTFRRRGGINGSLKAEDESVLNKSDPDLVVLVDVVLAATTCEIEFKDSVELKSV